MLTPAMKGYAEQADESGELYQSKVRQAAIGLEVFSDQIKAFYKNVARLYEKACRQVYSGPSRTFIDYRTNTEFVINRIMVDQNGNIVPMNYVENLPSYLIKIEEKRTGKSKKNEEIQQQVSLLQYVKNPVLSAALETQIASNLELGTEADQTLQMAGTEWMKFQLEQVQAQRLQISMQMKQMQQPPQAPQAPAGASATAKPQATAPAQTASQALGL
jgi:hypothetical protein